MPKKNKRSQEGKKKVWSKTIVKRQLVIDNEETRQMIPEIAAKIEQNELDVLREGRVVALSHIRDPKGLVNMSAVIETALVFFATSLQRGRIIPRGKIELYGEWYIQTRSAQKKTCQFRQEALDAIQIIGQHVEENHPDVRAVKHGDDYNVQCAIFMALAYTVEYG